MIVGALASTLVAGQSVAPPGRSRRSRRTVDGKPDLRGLLELRHHHTPRTAGRTRGQGRAERGGGRCVRETASARRQQGQPRATSRDADVSSAYNDFWWDRGTNIVGTRRTSLIVDPANGRIPALTEEGQRRAAERAAARKARGPADGPEDRNLAERCLVSLNAGPPIIPSAYNNNIQVFQTAGLGGHFQRDDPQLPHGAARRPSGGRRQHQAVDGGFPRALGRRHARHRDDQLPRERARIGVPASPCA